MARSGTNHKGGNSGGSIGNIVNAQDLARLLGISRNSVTTHAKQGMPVYDNKGLRGAHRFDTAAAIRWLRDREVQKHSAATACSDDEMDIEEIRRRRELALMKQAEIDLALKEERYGDIDAILQEVSAALSTVRASLISFPKYAAQLEHRDALEIEARLEEEIDNVLQELSQFEPDSDDSE